MALEGGRECSEALCFFPVRYGTIYSSVRVGQTVHVKPILLAHACTRVRLIGLVVVSVDGCCDEKREGQGD